MDNRVPSTRFCENVFTDKALNNKGGLVEEYLFVSALLAFDFQKSTFALHSHHDSEPLLHESVKLTADKCLNTCIKSSMIRTSAQ